MCCRSLNKNKSLEISKARHSETKVVLLGDSGVGKSSILLRYTQDEFSEDFEVTIGGAYMQTQVWLEDRTPVTLDVWDTAGQERYKSLLHLYYRKASAAIIVFDVGSSESFGQCEYWVKTLKEHEPECLLFLVGNKADLHNWEVDSEAAEDFAAKNKMQWIETSAKIGKNVPDLFKKVAEAINSKRLNL